MCMRRLTLLELCVQEHVPTIFGLLVLGEEDCALHAGDLVFVDSVDIGKNRVLTRRLE